MELPRSSENRIRFYIDRTVTPGQDAGASKRRAKIREEQYANWHKFQGKRATLSCQLPHRRRENHEIRAETSFTIPVSLKLCSRNSINQSKMNPAIHATTIICVRKKVKVAIHDGQVAVGDTVIKHCAKKVRRLYNEKDLQVSPARQPIRLPCFHDLNPNSSSFTAI